MLLKNIGKVKILTAGALSCALVAGTGSAALAGPGQSNLNESEVKAMEHAITQSLPTGKLAENSGLSSGAVSKDSPNQINLDGASLSIPLDSNSKHGTSSDDSLVVSGDSTDYMFRETKDGAQVLFKIDSPKSSHEKTFTISGDKELVSSEALGADTGEVFVKNSDGSMHSSFDAPWAYDANGNSVPTHFEVSGNKLTQVVEPTSETAYPIVSDPDWGKIGMCAATIAGNAALYIVPGGIVGKLLTKTKSIRKAAEILVRTLKAKSYNDKLKALRSLAFGLGADLTGIGAIAKACG